MLHTIQSSPASGENAVLRAMFAARKSVFVDLLKWDVPVLDGRYEVDQFDDAHATYLVVTDDLQRHHASARLLPTTRSHLLGDLYPYLCDQPPPRHSAVYEITRFCLDRELSAPERRMARDTLVTHLALHALASGIAAYTAIAEFGWFQQILAFGWRCAPLGLPRMEGRAMLTALRIDIDEDTPALLAAAGICLPQTTPVRAAA